jgi:hypothetical protein
MKLAFGFVSETELQSCDCDACDEDSAELLEDAQVFTRAAARDAVSSDAAR